MKTLRHFPIAPGRILGAWLCLLAVVLLWSPIYAAAWQSQGMACCSGGLCAAHGHPKQGQSHQHQPRTSETPMDCDHHGDNTLMACSMSCCHQTSSTLTTAVIFLLPEPAIVSRPAVALASPSNLAPPEFVQSFDPPSPPPRTLISSL